MENLFLVTQNTRKIHTNERFDSSVLGMSRVKKTKSQAGLKTSFR